MPHTICEIIFPGVRKLRQIALALTPDNRWYAGNSEVPKLLMHFILEGGGKNYARELEEFEETLKKHNNPSQST